MTDNPRGLRAGLARSDVDNVYTLAPERKPLSLHPRPTLGGSGIDFLPAFSFADYDAQVGRAPDLIAIPYFEGGYTPEGDVETLDWIRSPRLVHREAVRYGA